VTGSRAGTLDHRRAARARSYAATMSLVRTFGALALLSAASTTSCMLGGESRVAQGQLYTSGVPTYDAFFRDVHQAQVDAAAWTDDKKGANKPLTTSLELTPDAPEVTIVQATHESSSKLAKQPGSVRLETDGTTAHVVASNGTGDGASLFRAIEDSAHQELERAKRLHATEPKLDALAQRGTELETHVKTDFAKYGETKANEVTTELVAIHDVLAGLKTRAVSEAREGEDFVADLGRALETASEDKAARAERRRGHKKRDRDEGSPAPNTKPAATASEQAAAPPKSAPPKPADTGEVFTP
jgi:hypothetical protein